jgi:amino acid adenylation domain-containing protein
VFNSVGTHTPFDFGGLSAEVQVSPKHFVNFDLSFNFGISNGSLVLGCYYSTELYERETIQRWFGHFETLLRGILADPSQCVARLPLLSATERSVMRDWNETTMEFRRAATVHELFAEQVRKSPGAIAVVAGTDRLSYQDLNNRADALAGQLAKFRLGTDAPIGIFLERSAQLPAAILGVLKSGAAYVPLDPTLPAQRLAFVVEDAGMEVIVTQLSLVEFLPPTSARLVLVDSPSPAGGERPAADLIPLRVGPENLAYVMYTSGSTGKPKGVCVTHRNVVALVATAQRQYSREELDGVLFATSASFDVSVLESLVPICLGGKIVVAENILQIKAATAHEDVRLVSGVPSAIAELLRARLIPRTVTTIALCGEFCPQALVDALYDGTEVSRVWDLYGPTETTVYSSGCIRSVGGRPTIGRPFPNERMYIFDSRLQPVPVGVCGELYIGGDKVGRGYLRRPELTSERFIESALDPAGRIYRTGDRARFYPDGSIEFLGRLDNQVKVRGFRIELGEIESVLRQHPAVNECVVIARQDNSGVSGLVGYVVPVNPGSPSAKMLQYHLLQQLPEYMVPAAFVLLEKLPVTPNGKIDRRALPDPETTASSVAYVAPRTATEHIVAEIWRDVLQARHVGLHHNFFELGGHSLRASQVIARLNDALGIEVSMKQFFHAPTVASLGAVVDALLLEEIQTIPAVGAAYRSESSGVLVKP